MTYSSFIRLLHVLSSTFLLLVFIVLSPSFAQSKQTIEHGKKLFEEQGCATCHGSDFKGTQLGPPLARLKKTWKRQELLPYLKNPEQYAEKNPRLKKLASNYSMMKMPGFDFLKPTELQAIMDFLFTLK